MELLSGIGAEPKQSDDVSHRLFQVLPKAMRVLAFENKERKAHVTARKSPHGEPCTNGLNTHSFWLVLEALRSWLHRYVLTFWRSAEGSEITGCACASVGLMEGFPSLPLAATCYIKHDN